jgi:hypothetical protein
MARGNEIVVSAPESPRGLFVEGWVGAGVTLKPGMVAEIDPTVAVKGGRHTYKLYTAGADGNKPKGPLYVVRENNLIGKGVNDSYLAGDRVFLYVPIQGEELNMLVKFLGGAPDPTIAAGSMMMVNNANGKLIVTAGTPQSTPFRLLEAATAPTADVLTWCVFGGL